MRALRVWLVLTVAMVANGALRAIVLEPRLGPATAQAVSVAAAIVLILLVTRPFVRDVRLSQARTAQVAVAWVGWTVAFELAFGHWVMGASWNELLASYDLLNGRLWPLVLAAIAVAPFFGRPRRPLHFAPHGV
ncbi:MAG TPA: hypothetical protein VF092_07935 [Longimicrobium sp.]